MNLIKKRKVELSDIAKDLYQSLETYMLSCMENVSLASTIKDFVPSFSEAKKAPERQSYVPLDPKKEKKQRGEIQYVVKAEFKRAIEVPRGPNSVFDFANYLNRNHS
jgi:Rrf2 family iron-sulfur cluster assembly transcriptional regulator